MTTFLAVLRGVRIRTWAVLAAIAVVVVLAAVTGSHSRGGVAPRLNITGSARPTPSGVLSPTAPSASPTANPTATPVNDDGPTDTSPTATRGDLRVVEAEAAVRFMAVFLNTQDMTQPRWLDKLRPLATADLMQQLAGTDMTRVPVGRVGPVTAVDDHTTWAEVTVPVVANSDPHRTITTAKVTLVWQQQWLVSQLDQVKP